MHLEQAELLITPVRAEEQAAGGASQHATVEGADADPVGFFQKVFLKIPMLEQESAGLRAERLIPPIQCGRSFSARQQCIANSADS